MHRWYGGVCTRNERLLCSLFFQLAISTPPGFSSRPQKSRRGNLVREVYNYHICTYYVSVPGSLQATYGWVVIVAHRNARQRKKTGNVGKNVWHACGHVVKRDSACVCVLYSLHLRVCILHIKPLFLPVDIE